MQQPAIDHRRAATMLKRSEELRVRPSQPCEGLGIVAIRLVLALVDPAHLIAVGDKDLMAEGLEIAAHPG